jgi:2-dehydropantoate 2-reductase
MSRSYAIVGVGAIGGYYGGLLHRSGQDVHFLLHSDYEHVRQHGFLLETARFKEHYSNLPIYRDASEMPRCDVVIVALKTTANHLLPKLLPPIVKDGGAVLVLQNGLGSEDEVHAVVPQARILGGLCFICSGKVGPGHVRQTEYGSIRMGQYRPDGQPAGITPLLKDVAEDFRRTGLEIALEEDLLAARWKKLVWNVPFNGLSVVLNTSTDRLVQTPATRELCRALMNEVVQGAAACGHPVEASFIEKMFADTDRMKPYFPSMKTDFDQRRPLEIEHIYGHPLQEAKKHGLAMPRVETLYQLLDFIQQDLLKV